MSSTPSKNARRVLQDVAVNVSGTPSKLHCSSPIKTSNKAIFPVEEQENEGRLRGSFIGRKRNISEVDGAVPRADIARPVFGGHAATRGNQMLVCDRISNSLGDDESMTSKPAVVGETREPAIPLQEPQKSSTDEPALRTRSTPIRQSALDLLAAPRPHISTPASRATAKKQAEMLRIRLKLAMYKVKTNQIHVPMSELQFPSNESISSFSKPDFPATSSAPKTLSQQTQPRPNPKLLPAPVLVPTAYSARRITEPYMPSSPPCSASNSDLDAADSEADSENDFATPVAPRDRESLHPPVQLSSPPSSEKRIAITSRIYGAEGGLTSSVVKGRAANGLLELMQS